MAYEPLHHKYRPQTFRDLIGQEAIANTLTNALKLEKIAPAYLLTGPRGTGKTSSARILAKSLNCLAVDKPTAEPCGQCEVCQAITQGTALDVMEIDAASNTGVDNIREIIERSHFAPVQSRYKVYAIDECHMLSTPAFNALLKTLEEPPPRVVFILATTDPQRVIPTIISRCQRFDYRRISQEAMVEHLSYISEEEEIRITPEALTLIAQVANGGLRDAESLLDQLSLFPRQITVKQIWDLMGTIPEPELLALLKAIRTENIEEILAQCRSLLDRGREPLVLLQNLASFYLHLLLAKTAPTRQDLVPVTETCWQQLVTESQQWQTSQILQGQQSLKEGEIQLKNTTQPRLWLEIILLGLLSPKKEATPDSTIPVTSERTSQSPNITPIPPSTTHNPDKAATAKSVQPLSSLSDVASNPKQAITEQTRPKELSQPALSTSSTPEPRENTEGKYSALSDRQIPAQNPTPSIPPKQQTKKANYHSYTPEEISTIWQQVIVSINSPMTQALLRQQCHLISLEQNSAVVGISSPPLLKMNQGKVPQIEAGFSQVCQRKIKITLEVAAPTQQKVSKSTKPLAPAESNITKSTPQERSPNSPTAITPAPLPTTNTPPPENTIQNELTSPVSSFTEPLPTQQNQSQAALNQPTPTHNQEEQSQSQVILEKADSNEPSNFHQALQLITQKFDGEIIDLDNSDTAAASTSSNTELIEQKTNNTSPLTEPQQVAIKREPEPESKPDYDDEDVPF